MPSRPCSSSPASPRFGQRTNQCNGSAGGRIAIDRGLAESQDERMDPARRLGFQQQKDLRGCLNQFTGTPKGDPALIKGASLYSSQPPKGTNQSFLAASAKWLMFGSHGVAHFAWGYLTSLSMLGLAGFPNGIVN